jgi:hypothetical protein
MEPSAVEVAMPEIGPDRLTAAILVRDEAARLPGCLDSLRGAVDEAVVLDTGSGDGTVDLLARRAADPAQDPPLRWQSRPFDDFSRSRRALQALVTTPFVLWIDADERLSPGLAAELARRRREGTLRRHDLWQVERRNHALGRPLRARGLGTQSLARLGRTAVVAPSGEAVHEGMVCKDGRAAGGQLGGHLEHHALESVRAYLRKIDLYTTLEAGQGRSRYGWAQPLHLLATGPATFWRQWIWRGSWRDGRAGLVWALLGAWSATLRSWKVLRGGQARPR